MAKFSILQQPMLAETDEALLQSPPLEIRQGVLSYMQRFDDYTQNYDQICSDDLKEPKTPDVVKRIFTQLVQERAGGVVVDVGCGDGFVLKQVKAQKKVAVDIAFDYLARLPEEILKIWCWAEEIPLCSGAFDTVICTDVIEHVLDHKPVAAQLARLVKPGGKILMAFPFEQDLSVYDMPEYKARFGKYKYVHLRSIDDAFIQTLFPSNYRQVFSHLITEGMPLMLFKPYAIKFVEFVRES